MLCLYKGLLGSKAVQLKGIEVPIVRKGRQLSSCQVEGLILPVFMVEIDKALVGMGNNKAPGCDGFNDKFSKKGLTNY